VTVADGPRLGEVRAASRETPPGVEVLLIERAGREGRATEVSLARAPGQPLRVVLDPGHGGIEDGAIGPSGLKEKDLVLDVARRLAVLLRLEGFEVTLTRNGDDDISLDDRAGIANEKRADLFVSLHANAARHRGAFGAETFFLAPEASDDEARTLAALENNAARVDDESGRLNADGELPLILWDMAQLGYLEESARLARTIQDRLNILLDIRDRGVRQAPFRVLVGATCPAVLVELGFLTNPAEEARLAGGAYRRQLAEALRDAIGTFRAELPREAPVVGGAP
jgi:N-acetylmuramoyl-L-alanine amidase